MQRRARVGCAFGRACSRQRGARCNRDRRWEGDSEGDSEPAELRERFALEGGDFRRRASDEAEAEAAAEPDAELAKLACAARTAAEDPDALRAEASAATPDAAAVR